MRTVNTLSRLLRAGARQLGEVLVLGVGEDAEDGG